MLVHDLLLLAVAESTALSKASRHPTRLLSSFDHSPASVAKISCNSSWQKGRVRSSARLRVCSMRKAKVHLCALLHAVGSRSRSTTFVSCWTTEVLESLAN